MYVVSTMTAVRCRGWLVDLRSLVSSYTPVCDGKCPTRERWCSRRTHVSLDVSLQRLNFVDVATGSLGQGLSCSAGMAYVGKYFDKAE